MGEILKPAGQFISQHVPLTVLIGILLFSIFFKIPRKEINILGWLVQKLGNVLLGGVRKDIKDLKEDNASKFAQLKSDTDKRIEELEDKTFASFDEIRLTNNHNCQIMQERLKEVEKQIELQSMARIRAHVLNFSDDLRRGNQRTKEDYDNILNEDKEYETIISKYQLKNNVYKHAIEFINKRYDESMLANNFATY